MTSRNWVKLFFTTLLIGGITTVVIGFIVFWNKSFFADFKIFEIFSTLVLLLMKGFLFSLISQLGFFAYLTVHRMGLGIFKSVSLWNGVQVVLILFALYDFWSYMKSSKQWDINYFLIPAITIVIIGIATAWVKMKQTNHEAFIPALFVMIFVTLVEWAPGMKVNDPSWFYLMMISLMVCNAYQLLILHKLNAKSVEERQRRAANKKGATMQKKIAKKPSV